MSHVSDITTKPVFGVSDIRHKPGCKAVEDGLRLEISDFGSRGIELCSKNREADHTADLHLCFPDAKSRVSHDAAHIIHRGPGAKTLT